MLRIGDSPPDFSRSAYQFVCQYASALSSMYLQYARTHSEKSYLPSAALVSRKPSMCKGYTRVRGGLFGSAPPARQSSSQNIVDGRVSLSRRWITTDVLTAVTQSLAA